MAAEGSVAVVAVALVEYLVVGGSDMIAAYQVEVLICEVCLGLSSEVSFGCLVC